MSSNSCTVCLKPRAHLQCGICQCSICKGCAQIVEETDCEFLPAIPEVLAHGVYCQSCFDAQVAPELTSYQETLERARNVLVFYKAQSKETRLLRRSEPPLKVDTGADRDETLLHLAFLAAHRKFNALIDVEIDYEKVRTNGYQTTNWSGRGIPVQVDPDDNRWK